MDHRKKYTIQDENPYPHMGEMLQYYLQEHGIRKATLARKINIAPNGILGYFKQESLQVGTLWKISAALNHNFLAEIAAQHPLHTQHPPQPTPRELELEEQVKALQVELEVYKRLTEK
jgi:transcriptional regulator with XRE-family HTH domain